jgi:hypothetical protein
MSVEKFNDTNAFEVFSRHTRTTRCRVRRSMPEMGLGGAVRGPAWTRRRGPASRENGRSIVDRHFTAPRPNPLLVPHFTYMDPTACVND